MDKGQIREIIARRVSKELHDGDVVNLGIGLPTLVANYIPENVHVLLHSENGLLGMGPAPEAGQEDDNLRNAGSSPVTAIPGAATFSSLDSFAIIRGGHLNATVLGALQVDEEGSIANWMVPGKLTPGMGGAMDLLAGTKNVIAAMEHTQKGTPKILHRCNLPLTAQRVVNLIVTEMGVMKVTEDGLVLTEINPLFSVDEVQAATEARLIIASDLIAMEYN